MAANEELPVKDVERGSQHIEEKLHYTDINKDDVGYKEYLESLEVASYLTRLRMLVSSHSENA
jgi:hypothetical protein